MQDDSPERLHVVLMARSHDSAIDAAAVLEGVDVDIALDADQAAPLLRMGNRDALLADLDGMSERELEFLNHARELSPWLPILCFGAGDETTLSQRARLAKGILALPDIDVVRRHLMPEVRLCREQRRNARLSRCVAHARELGVPLGFAPAWRRAMRTVEESLRDSRPIVLIGEASTGRRTLAQHLHSCKTDESESFLEVDAAFDVSALASFDTIYFRELDALGRECIHGLQSLVMGGGGPQLVLATSRSKTEFERAAATHFLREAKAEIVHVPPIRERREDIAMLATSFLDSIATDGKHQGFSLRALTLLQLWHWPGNLSELHDVVRAAHELAGSKQIGRRHLVGAGGRLPASLQLFAQSLGDEITSMITAEEGDILPFELEERSILARALVASGGNVTRAAAALEIGRATLYRKIRDYGLRD